MQIYQRRLHLRTKRNSIAESIAHKDVRKISTHTRKWITMQGKLKDRKAKRSVQLIKAGTDPRKDGEAGCLLMEFGTITLFD